MTTRVVGIASLGLILTLDAVGHAENTWLLWMGIETVAGTVWQQAKPRYFLLDECQVGAEVYAQQWEKHMKGKGRDTVRTGTDVSARLESGAVALTRFVCLPDTTDPRHNPCGPTR